MDMKIPDALIILINVIHMEVEGEIHQNHFVKIREAADQDQVKISEQTKMIKDIHVLTQ